MTRLFKFINAVKILFLQSCLNCLRNKVRSLFIIGIFMFGSFGALIFEGVNQGIFAQYRINTIHSKYGHGALYPIHYWGKVQEEPWKNWLKNADELKSSLESSSYIKGVYPRVSFFALVSNQDLQSQGIGTGVDGIAESEFFNGLNYTSGKAILGKRDGITLGTGLAKNLAAELGSSVTLSVTTHNGSMNAETFEVVGISELGVQEIDNRSFQIDYKSAQALLDTQAVESFALALKDDASWDKFSASFKNLNPSIFKNTEAISFEALDWIYYGNSVNWLGRQFSLYHFILVLVVFLGVYQSIAILIMGRKSEIGFQRANGEQRSRILLSQCLECGILYVIGFFAGIGLVYFVGSVLLSGGLTLPPPPGFTTELKFSFLLSFSSLPKFFLVFFAAAFLATIITATRILRLSITECISQGSAQ
jgi:putative ABC transport system permease protein